MLSHLPFLHIVSDRNLRLLYTVRAIKDLLNRLTMFFLPIYLFTLGYQGVYLANTYLTDLQRGMIMVAGYLLLMRIIIFVTAIPVGQITHKVGFSRALMYAYTLRLLSFASLVYLETYPILLVVAIVFEAIQSNFFWNSFFTILTEQSESSQIGSNLGGMQLMLQIVSAISPAISGILAINFGFGAVFMVGIVLLLVSMIFVMQMDLHMVHDRVTWRGFNNWFQDASLSGQHLSIVGRYANDAALFVWPLYVFLLLGSVEKVGYLYTLSLFLAIVVTFFISIYLDKTKNRKPFFLSGGFMSLLWIARTQVLGVWSIALVDVFERLAANYHWLFYDMIFIRSGKGKHAYSNFVYREMVMSIGAVIFWSLFVAFFAVTTSWNAIFIVGGVSVLLSLLLLTGKDGTARFALK